MLNTNTIIESLVKQAVPERGIAKPIINDWYLTDCVVKALFNKGLIQQPLNSYNKTEQDSIKLLKSYIADLCLVKLNNKTYKIKSYYLAKYSNRHSIRYSQVKCDYILDIDNNVIISMATNRHFDVGFRNCRFLDDCSLVNII